MRICPREKDIAITWTTLLKVSNALHELDRFT
jgi:hypothetical protein